MCSKCLNALKDPSNTKISKPLFYGSITCVYMFFFHWHRDVIMLVNVILLLIWGIFGGKLLFCYVSSKMKSMLFTCLYLPLCFMPGTHGSIYSVSSLAPQLALRMIMITLSMLSWKNTLLFQFYCAVRFFRRWDFKCLDGNAM